MSTLEQLEEYVAALLGSDDLEAVINVDDVEKLMTEVEEKRDAFGAYIMRMERRAEALRVRVREIENRARRMENKAKNLKHLAAQIMQRHGHKKLEGTEITMTLIEGQNRLVIDDERKIPDSFKETREVVVNSIVKEALEFGSGAVPGAHLEKGPDTVRVYS